MIHQFIVYCPKNFVTYLQDTTLEAITKNIFWFDMATIFILSRQQIKIKAARKILAGLRYQSHIFYWHRRPGSGKFKAGGNPVARGEI
jgi:hypothetical protein